MISENRSGRHARPTTRPLKRWQYSLFTLFALTTLCAVLLSIWEIGRNHPLETLIIVGIYAGAVVAVALYVGQLTVIGWLLDLPIRLAELSLHSAHVPLEIEHLGEIAVVNLGDNIASPRECRSVQQQLDRLIAAGHCDLVIDFASIKKLASGFREVLAHAAQAARKAAEKQGKPCRSPALAAGETFRIFADRESALEEMSRFDGHGWIVLCAVPVGIRAVE